MFMGKLNLVKALAVVVFAFILQGCDSANLETKQTEELKVGLLPDRDPEELKKQYTPLFDYLSTRAGVKYKLVVPQNYQELVLLFEQGAIDIGFFGGYTFVKAQKEHGAVPIVMRDVDRSFLSVIVARKDSGLNSLKDLEGKTFSFGSDLSTSGHLMPRFYFSKSNITPEEYFSKVEFSQAHNKTMEHVFDGRVEAGVLNANVYNRMISQNPEMAEQLKVIWQSPPYPDYVWAAQADLSEDVINDLLVAFLSLDLNNTEEAQILKSVDAEVFYPATVNDFSELQQAIVLLNSVPKGFD